MIVPNIPLVCVFLIVNEDRSKKYGSTPVLYIQDQELYVLGNDSGGTPAPVKLKEFIATVQPTQVLVAPIKDGYTETVDGVIDMIEELINGGRTTS